MIVVRRHRRSRSLWWLTACVAVIAGGACSGDDAADDTERFCGEVDSNMTELTKPTLRNDGDVTGLVDLYGRIGELAPLAIEDEWDALTTLYATASTVDPSDPDSRQRVSEQAFRTERSVVEVRRWLRQNCRVTLPVSTIVDHDVKVSVPPTTALPG